MENFVNDNCIFLTVAGSHAYGLNDESSDIDIRGICIPPKNYLMGFFYNFEQQDGGLKDKTIKGVKLTKDTTIFCIKKAFKLMAECNPNMIDLLYTDPKHFLLIKQWWERVLENRNLFISKKAKHTFSGYAMSQLKRIKTHKNWLMNPPKNKPNRKDYGLSEGERAFSNEHINAILATPDEYFNDKIKIIAQKEKQYYNDLRYWQQYENWKQTRNHSRAILEEKYGYDCKHASHLVRLMRMGYEILDKCEVNVDRTNIDADELKAIKKGSWSYERVITYAEEMDKKLNDLYLTTKLPNSANYKKLDELLVNLLDEYYISG